MSALVEANGPKGWVARKHGEVVTVQRTSVALVRWLKDHGVRGAITTYEVVHDCGEPGCGMWTVGGGEGERGDA